MIIYKAGQNEPSELKEAHDPDAKKIYRFIYKATDWVAATAYISSEAVVAPLTPNGFYYIPLSGGITGAAEPTWPTEAGETVVDGTVEWMACAWDLFCTAAETITASSWTADIALTMDSTAFTDEETVVRVTAVPAGTTEFTLTNHATKSNLEEDDRSILVKVTEM